LAFLSLKTPLNFLIRPLNEDLIDDFVCLADWENNLEIRHLIRPHKNAASLESTISAKELFDEHQQARIYNQQRGVVSEQWMFCVDEVPVGHGSLMLNPPHRVTKGDVTVAWFGLEVGSSEMRRLGIGSQILIHLEKAALLRGATLAEVGVFEFNEASLGFFKSRGYRVVERLEHFSYWQGKMWADLRLVKTL